ncbi:MAG: lytic transglycosylase domain-containing protein [Micromonosporaceae bacterium]|nr:lytic transglycosylase domain-containing protein [Micromonosporaceae bacterium]
MPPPPGRGAPWPRSADEPTRLTPEVPSHRRPARRFQVIGVFVLVVGAVAGSYTALSSNDNRPAPAPIAVSPPASLDPAVLAARDSARAKAEAAAAEAAERARQANEVAAAEEAAAQQAAQTPTPDVPASCDEYTGNRALGCALLLEAGFGLDQMSCLDQLWTRESNWRAEAHNSSSGAHGIPQALPAEKMAPYGADYLTNPVPQIRWGLDYIRNRYSTPCGAWSFWQSHHYY